MHYSLNNISNFVLLKKVLTLLLLILVIAILGKFN
jgi:hypothetical protein